jgi:hypothetical protein
VKNYLIGGLVCLVLALAVGVKPLKRAVNEALNHGRLTGVENCISYSSSELLSPEAVTATCVRAFQKRIYGNDLATGRAGPKVDQRIVGWGGVLENKTPNHVTTWIQLTVSIFDAEGTEQEFSAETPLWIDPLGKAEFRVELPDLTREQLENIKFCERDDETRTACMTWGVTDIKGLSI